MALRPFRKQIEAGKLGEAIARKWLEDQYGRREVEDVSDDPEYQQRDIDFVVNPGRIREITFEVKADFRAHETGNLFLEFDALDKSKADYWLYVIPQRRWLFKFSLEALREYARLHFAEARSVTSVDERTGRTWVESGVPLRMQDVLLNVPTILYTRIGGEEDPGGQP